MDEAGRCKAFTLTAAGSPPSHSHADESALSRHRTSNRLWHAVAVASPSADVAGERPFYDRHADAYDALITDSVEPWVTAVDECLQAAGFSNATVLDAGCGTGRHAAALIERGHDVTLLDASAALLAIARKRCPDAPALVTDLCAPAVTGPFDAVVSRGVLNDLLTDQERTEALRVFAELTRAGGVLVLDVRETAMSRQRADGTWRTTEADLPDGSHLRFTSRPTWNDGRIVVEERYELDGVHGEATELSEFLFEMRPWTRDEMRGLLSGAGYGRIEMRDGVGRRSPDRLLVTARR
jgi:SAM-dependent methyltransferase